MNEHHRLIERIIRTSFNQISKPQQKVMAELIPAIKSSENFTLRDIASNLSGSTDAKHKLKKLQYFLDGLKVSNEFWSSYINLIFSLPGLKLSQREKLSITIKSSMLGTSFKILTFSISYKNKALPVFVQVSDVTANNSNLLKQINDALILLSEVLPDKYDYLFIADLFGLEQNIILMLQDFGFDYIIRIRPQFLRLKDSKEITDISLFPDGVYQQSTFDDLNPETNTNITIISIEGEDNSRSGMYLASNLVDKEKISQNYLRRMIFEEDSHFLIKKLRWSEYSRKTPLVTRLEKLIIINCMGLAFYSVQDTDQAKYLQHILVNLNR